MELNIAERIALLNILPFEGNIITLRVVRELQSELSFTEDEIKQWKIKNTMQPDGRGVVVWDSDFTAKTKDIKIGDTAKGVIVEQLKKLEQQQKLRLEMLDLYEKFVDGKTT